MNKLIWLFAVVGVGCSSHTSTNVSTGNVDSVKNQKTITCYSGVSVIYDGAGDHVGFGSNWLVFNEVGSGKEVNISNSTSCIIRN